MTLGAELAERNFLDDPLHPLVEVERDVRLVLAQTPGAWRPGRARRLNLQVSAFFFFDKITGGNQTTPGEAVSEYH
jgi:hypothetical protein